MKKNGLNVTNQQGFYDDDFLIDIENHIVKDTGITFNDVGGMKYVKEILKSVALGARKLEIYENVGADNITGVLLSGNSGTGKTLIARALAGEMQIPLIEYSALEISYRWNQCDLGNISQIFEYAKENAPFIVFIDEIDVIAKNGHSSFEMKLLYELLVCIDRLKPKDGVIFLAATNYDGSFDMILKRSVRNVKQINVYLPCLEEREEILKIHARNKKLSGEIDLKELAHLTFFYSSVTLAKILNEAAIIQHFAGHDVITQEDLDEAHRNFRFGFRNSEMCHNSTDERHAVSIHELGHAFCSKNKIKEISIISRSSSSGYTWYAEENPSYVTANVLKNRIIELLGGRAAEKVVLGVVSTGAKNDIERALDIACDYIAKYGMSNSMGLLCINPESVDESMKKEILSEARKMMSELFEEAIKIVVKNKEAIIKISEVLEEKEIISGEEFYKLLKKYSI